MRSQTTYANHRSFLLVRRPELPPLAAEPLGLFEPMGRIPKKDAPKSKTENRRNLLNSSEQKVDPKVSLVSPDQTAKRRRRTSSPQPQVDMEISLVSPDKTTARPPSRSPALSSLSPPPRTPSLTPRFPPVQTALLSPSEGFTPGGDPYGLLVVTPPPASIQSDPPATALQPGQWQPSSPPNISPTQYHKLPKVIVDHIVTELTALESRITHVRNLFL